MFRGYQALRAEATAWGPEGSPPLRGGLPGRGRELPCIAAWAGAGWTRLTTLRTPRMLRFDRVAAARTRPDLGGPWPTRRRPPTRAAAPACSSGPPPTPRRY